jgi:hypothetical protein
MMEVLKKVSNRLPWQGLFSCEQRTFTRTTVTTQIKPGRPHSNKNSIYVFQEKKLRGLRPNFHIHVSVSDLYISIPAAE